jgi:hypothetical protein
MVLSTEPADRCRAASCTMTVLASITAFALLVVGFASPASAQAVPHTNNAVVATVSRTGQAVPGPAGGVIEVQLRDPASCRKHACRATLSKPAAIVVLLVNVLAGQGQRTAVICSEFASGPAYAGGDPVNGSDPSGEDPGVTIGFCGNLSAYLGFFIGLGGGSQPCVVRSLSSNGASQFGLTETDLVGGPGAGVEAEASVYLQVSNASYLGALNGAFYAVSAAASPFFGGGGDVFWGVTTGGTPTGIVGIEAGPGVGIAFQASLWFQSTSVQVAHHWWEGSGILESTWNQLDRRFGVSTFTAQTLLTYAGQVALSHSTAPSASTLLPCISRGVESGVSFA